MGPSLKFGLIWSVNKSESRVKTSCLSTKSLSKKLIISLLKNRLLYNPFLHIKYSRSQNKVLTLFSFLKLFPVFPVLPNLKTTTFNKILGHVLLFYTKLKVSRRNNFPRIFTFNLSCTKNLSYVSTELNKTRCVVVKY